jgi:hypothetical protein
MAFPMSHSILLLQRTRDPARRTLPVRQGIPGTSGKNTDSSAYLYTRRIPHTVCWRKGTSSFLWPLASAPDALANKQECAWSLYWSKTSSRLSLELPEGLPQVANWYCTSGGSTRQHPLPCQPNSAVLPQNYQQDAIRSATPCSSSPSRLPPPSQALWGAL